MTARQPQVQAHEILPPVGSEASKEPGFAVAGAVHDLGNLIQIATSALNLLARAPDIDGRRSAPLLERARASLDHAGAIVRQTIDQARSAVAIIPCADLDTCVSEVAALIAGNDDTRLTVIASVEAKLPCLACDPVGLRRALLNLVFNARDAMDGTGTIRIEARAASPGVELRVTDQGRGMSPATLARVFDPYFTTKRDGLGGVGLPMVERFIRTAGGQLTIESELGAGTVVTLCFPTHPKEIMS